MKTITAFTASALLCVLGGALLNCVSFGFFERYVPGRYTGEGYGQRGPIRVMVETGKLAIISIEVIESREDAWIGGEAMAELRDMVLESGTTGVDAVSGATLSSEGFLSAVNAALQKAAKTNKGRGPAKNADTGTDADNPGIP